VRAGSTRLHLHTLARLQARSRVGHVHCPVQADHVYPGRPQALHQAAAAHGVQRQRHMRTLRLCLAHDARDVRPRPAVPQLRGAQG
jgi:hypothetical protein